MSPIVDGDPRAAKEAGFISVCTMTRSSDPSTLPRRHSVAALFMFGALATSCAPMNASDTSKITVERVDASRYAGAAGDPLESVCRQWRLSPAQVAAFFRHSIKFDGLPAADFYQIPCSISGKLIADGTRWDFVVGGGATGSWRNASAIQYWGCKSRECEALVLLPYDAMNPDP